MRRHRMAGGAGKGGKGDGAGLGHRTPHQISKPHGRAHTKRGGRR